MEYLVKEFDGQYFGVTQPNFEDSQNIKVVWETAVISYPWRSRQSIYDRYQVIRELTDEEAQKQIFIWKIKSGKRFE